ncbi:MAG: CHAT domain-containing protein [Caldilineaceae bacterium]
MADLAFIPSKSVTTLAAVMTKLLANWTLLPAPLQVELDARRLRFCDDLLALKDFQRPNKLIDFLQWLESVSEVTAITRTELAAGKGPVMRSGFVQISDTEVQQLRSTLEAKSTGAPTTKSGIELTFQVQIEFKAKIDANTQQPFIVHLVPAVAELQADSIIVTFEELGKPVPLEVGLLAPGFTEQTGDWTRTIYVFSNGVSLPAIFLLKAGANLGDQRITVDFRQPVGRTLHQTEIAAPSKDVTRGAEPATARSPFNQLVDFYTRVDFPAQVRPQEERPLIVQLTLQRPQTTALEAKVGVTFADVRKPVQIEVVATALGFTERTQNWRRVITVYSQTDSQPAVFLLKAGAAVGSQLIRLDFYHQGRLVGSGEFFTEVTPNITFATPEREAQGANFQLEELPANPPSPADLELRIVFNRQTNEMHFTLHSEIAALGYQRRFMGTTPLNQNPRQFLENTFARLSQYARRSFAPSAPRSTADEPNRVLRPIGAGQADGRVNYAFAAEIVDEIETIGQELFRAVFPPSLQQEYWQIKALRDQNKVHSLLVISDEPWIPWELIKPYTFDDKTNQELSDDYLGVAFQFVRWLAGRGPAQQVKVKAARVVVPEANLPATEREKTFFTGLEKQGVMVGQPLRTRSEVLQTVKQGEVKLLHLAAHGNFIPTNADESPIALQNGEQLRPLDLAGARSAGFRRERPLVFLNACHTGQAEFTLTGLGGWAERLVGDIGVGAFVGSLWEVHDELAADFAIAFYKNLIAEQTFGEAFHNARLSIRQAQPANPTWLAYTLYADPNGKLTLGN